MSYNSIFYIIPDRFSTTVHKNFTYMQWDMVVVHRSRQSDWGSIVGHGPDHVQMAGGRAQ